MSTKRTRKLKGKSLNRPILASSSPCLRKQLSASSSSPTIQSMSSDIRNSNENAAINIHNQIPHNLNNAQSTLRAPSSPTSTPAIDRLMGDREQRLTETRKKLALWEENLTLAQVDQDRQRKEVQERMKEVNLVKDQWKKSRETLKVERRQMDVLSKSLKNRESAISARERQTTFMEEQLKERQTKMEQAAIAMAEKKILKEYNEKNERLIKKEKELEIKEKKWREKLLKEQCVLTEMQEKLNSNLKKYEADRNKLDGILEKKKLEMNRINEKCQKKEKQLLLYNAEYNSKKEQLDKAAGDVAKKEKDIIDREKNLRDMEESLEIERNKLNDKEKRLNEIEFTLKNEKETFTLNKKKFDEKQTNFEKIVALHESQALQDDKKLNERKNIIVNREKNYNIKEEKLINKYEDIGKKLKDQENELLSTKQTLNESMKNMCKEREELNTLSLQLEERRRLLDIFGEDCEHQREVNEKERLNLMESRMTLDQLKMQLNMETVCLEQEKFGVHGRIGIHSKQSNNQTKVVKKLKNVSKKNRKMTRENKDKIKLLTAQGSATSAVRKKKQEKSSIDNNV